LTSLTLLYSFWPAVVSQGVKPNALLGCFKVQAMTSLWRYIKYSAILSPTSAVLSHKMHEVTGPCHG
jgi:hypothetical protein